MSRLSFLALPRPIVTCILKPHGAADAIATMKNGEYDGAPAFAVHLESFGRENLTDDNLRKMASATRKPVMFLHYRTGPDAQGRAPLTDEERVDLLLRAIRCGGTAVDFTADTFDESPLEFTANPAAIDRQRRAIDDAHELGGEVIMSSHIYQPRSCEQVLEHMKAVEDRGVDIAKIVTQVETEEQFLEAVRTTMALRREMKVPFIHLSVGRFGRMHRYLSPALGNALTFCPWRYTEEMISDQPLLKNMMNVLDSYNWHIDDGEEKQ